MVHSFISPVTCNRRNSIKMPYSANPQSFVNNIIYWLIHSLANSLAKCIHWDTPRLGWESQRRSLTPLWEGGRRISNSKVKIIFPMIDFHSHTETKLEAGNCLQQALGRLVQIVLVLSPVINASQIQHISSQTFDRIARAADRSNCLWNISQSFT